MQARPFLERLHLLLWTILVLLLGYLFGVFLLQVEGVSAPAPLSVHTRDVHRRVPLVRITGIRDGRIVGVVGTGARLLIGESIVTPRPDRTFSIASEPFLENIVDVPVPREAVFVASRRGKNYYPVASRAAENLKPENRLYFRSTEEAEALGYKRAQ